jgi:dTDP-4-amino-4,6-dideoxygalactose transaminase
MDGHRIPYHRPSIGPEEIAEVTSALESGWLTTGPRTEKLERDFREYVRAPYALAVNSCTAGLHLALAALHIGAGAEVITTPMTFCATVNVILHAGATPVLADIGPDGNIDPECIAARITERTRAIIPVHMAGLPCDMEKIWSLARRHRLHVIEDAAHAAGARYNGWPVGAGNPETGDYSDACSFSFYATKNLTTGEGGMLTSHREDLADLAKILCLHGISRDAWSRYTDRGTWFYQVLAPGFKYNLSDVQSAIGVPQLQKLDQFIAIRTRYAQMYSEILGDLEQLELPPNNARCQHSWHLYTIRLNLDSLQIDRDEFIHALKQRGVGTSVHFIPIPMHPAYAALAQRPENECPRAMALYPRLVSLPLYPAMTEGEVAYVARAVTEILRANRRRRPLAAAVSGGR